MSLIHMQLVKYAFPTFAFIIGIWWYKRRRMDRVDPGGIKSLDPKDNNNKTNNITENTDEIPASQNLTDSGVNSDDSLSLSSSNQLMSELICSPRKVSESLNIPSRRSTSIPISIRSSRSSGDSGSWNNDNCMTPPNALEIKLSSNPKTSSFDAMAKVKGGTSFDKRTSQFENLTEENEKEERIVVDPLEKLPTDVETNCKMNGLDEPKPSSVSNNCEIEKKVEVQISSERDSANHSPISGVLDGSVTDEAGSEGSTDSGKGGSINGHTKNLNNSETMLYEFFVPLNLIGRLVGRQRGFFQTVRLKAGVKISIKKPPSSQNFQTCVIQGSEQGINTALEMIRKRFPENIYPDLTLEQIALSVLPEEISWSPEFMCLSLIEGVNNDIVICHIYKPNRLFIQLPTHPSYPALRILDATMTQLYETTESPAVPTELQRGMIVVAKWYDKWVRVYVEQSDPNGENHLVRLVDHGGYWTFSHAELRKIRSDFLTLPFQSIEVFLANIAPKNGEWQNEAYDVIAYMCTGVVVQAQIEGYINSNVYVNLFVNIQKHGVISISDELIARGCAESITLEETVPEDAICYL